ncbi:MAG: type II toxin-antitoxin system HicB family antitoxin [Spirochaetaceae bacterium]|jgi:predicted RNase H-like HicB family nuclease|nr:type II toxin-antitoxin system HicB family antitoxin [Spirochaetaceae bacterium]
MKLKYTYWPEDGWFLGYFDDYPEHWTQGKTVEELEYMLIDLYKLLELDKTEVAVQKRELEFA